MTAKGGGRFAWRRRRPRKTIFVASDGNDLNPGSYANPVATLTHAVDIARPGDTIQMRGGVYDNTGNAYITLNFSGTDEYPTTIRAHEGETPIIDGYQHENHPRTVGDGLNITGPKLLTFNGSHVVWSGLELRGSVGHAIYVRGDHNRFEHINTHHHHSRGITTEGSYNTFEWFDVHDCYSISNGGNSADGFTILEAATPSIGNIIRYLRSWNNSDDGIGLWTNVFDTLIEYSAVMNSGIGTTGDGMGYKCGNDVTTEAGTLVRRCVSAGNGVRGFYSNLATGVTYEQCTSYAEGDAGFYLRADSAATEGHNEAHGNISAENTPPYYEDEFGPAPVHTLNTWNLGITDPQFMSTDPTSPDFLALAAGSPCIGAGPDGSDLGAIPFGERFPLDLSVFVDQVGGTPPTHNYP